MSVAVEICGPETVKTNSHKESNNPTVEEMYEDLVDLWIDTNGHGKLLQDTL